MTNVLQWSVAANTNGSGRTMVRNRGAERSEGADHLQMPLALEVLPKALGTRAGPRAGRSMRSMRKTIESVGVELDRVKETAKREGSAPSLLRTEHGR